MGEPESPHTRYYEGSVEYAEMLEAQEAENFDLYVRLFSESVPSGATVLDVGCGVGTSTYLLREKGFEATGSDIGHGLPEEKGFLRIDFSAAGALADGSFQAVGAMNVLEHVEKPRDFLAEMVRVCARGGHVILISPNLTSPLVPIRAMLDLRAGRTPYLGIGGYGEGLRLLASNLRRSLRAALGGTAFERRRDTLASGIVGYDTDAIYWTNAAEVSRFLGGLDCEIERYQGVGRGRLARLVARFLPSFAGLLLIVARPRDAQSS